MTTVTVQLDPNNPMLCMDLDVPECGATVRWVKEELCKQDPTGSAEPDSFRLICADQPWADPLEDSVPLTPALGTLVLKPIDPEEEAREQEEREFLARIAKEEEDRQIKEAAVLAERKAREEESERLEKLVVEGGGEIETEGLKKYICTGKELYMKKSPNPRSGKIVKFKWEQNSEVGATGRVWTGPNGGVWAELTPFRDDQKGKMVEQAWVLVEGPGFGLEGPALIDPDDADDR